MKSPFVWGKGGRAMTPEEVDRERQLVALARAKMGDTSPVGHWTQGATRVVDALGAVLREKRTNKAEAAGLAEADALMQAEIDKLRGGAGGGVYASTSGGGSPSGTWTPDATPGPVAQATQGVTGGLSFPGQPAADTGVAQGGLGFGSAVMTPQEMLIEGARRRGLDPIDVATAISYETGGKFDPMIAGPTTQWGTHRGLIQFGEPQAKQNGVDFSSPEAAWRTQLDPTNGGVWNYLEGAGVKPGMGLPEIYSGINAGSVGRMGASDANNGGAPGTVADKVAGMGPHRDKAAAFLGGTWTPNPDAGGGAVTMSTSGTGGGYGGGGTGGVDIASLLALQKNPWVAKKYGGVVDALMGQQFSRQNALWEQQQKMADPMYQAQLAELTAPKPVDPFAGTKEIGGVLYGPDGQGGFVPLITPPAAGGARPLTDPAERAQWGIPATDTRPYAIEAGKPPQVVGGGGVTVNNDLGGSDKFEEAFAKGDAATIETVNNAGLAAQRNLGRIDQLESILSSTPTGMGASLAQAAGEWGIPTEGLSEIQAAEALINSLVPEQRQPGSGPMSDADLALFKQSLPRIINQPGGNQVIIDTMRAIAQYDAEGAAIVQRMRLPPDDPNYLDRSAAFSALQNRPNPLESIKAAGGGGDAAAPGVPAGIDPTDWQFMTPEEKALFK